MGRAKLRLELLSKDKARRKTYETRKKGLEKKADQLSKLCGIDLCMIMYPPPLKNEDGQIQPFVWSNNPGRVSNLIESHKLSMSGDDFSRPRTYTLSSFYEDHTRKIKEETEKPRIKNREAKYPAWDQRYDSLSPEELKNLSGILTDKIKVASDLLQARKAQVTGSNISMNQVRTQENYGCSSMVGMVTDRRFEQYYPLPYLDDSLEYERRMKLAAMTINNAVFNYGGNGMINFSPPMMSYKVNATSDQHIGQDLMINNNPADYFPAAYGQDYNIIIGQGLMPNNPTGYNFPQMDASHGLEDNFNLWTF